MAEEMERIGRGSEIRVEALSPESMKELGMAMKESSVYRLKEVLSMHAAIDNIAPETIDKMTRLVQGAAANGGCGIGCW